MDFYLKFLLSNVSLLDDRGKVLQIEGAKVCGSHEGVENLRGVKFLRSQRIKDKIKNSNFNVT